MNKIGISVIVCCYNSALRLPETLKHLALQQLIDEIQWEVIIVNNASIDNTEEVCFNEWGKYQSSAGFAVIYEPEPGIIFARGKGLSIANYEYIVFCDDDNWLQADYLQTAYNLMEVLADAGALGGQGEVVTDQILPDWWEKEKNSYAVGSQAEKQGDVTKRGYLWGTGLISRKSILDQVFNPYHPFLLTGRKGNLITSGDDAEICSRIILLGWRLYYQEKLHYKHYISKKRLTNEYRNKLLSGFESTYEIQEKYKLAIEYSFFPFPKKIRYLLKRGGLVLSSGFNKRKVWMFNTFVFFAFGIKIINDKDMNIIYNFARQK
jgi:glycosyltransferase involved in cell wall biosynthesis